MLITQSAELGVIRSDKSLILGGKLGFDDHLAILLARCRNWIARDVMDVYTAKRLAQLKVDGGVENGGMPKVVHVTCEHRKIIVRVKRRKNHPLLYFVSGT